MGAVMHTALPMVGNIIKTRQARRVPEGGIAAAIQKSGIAPATLAGALLGGSSARTEFETKTKQEWATIDAEDRAKYITKRRVYEPGSEGQHYTEREFGALPKGYVKPSERAKKTPLQQAKAPVGTPAVSQVPSLATKIEDERRKAAKPFKPGADFGDEIVLRRRQPRRTATTTLFNAGRM